MSVELSFLSFKVRALGVLIFFNLQGLEDGYGAAVTPLNSRES